MEMSWPFLPTHTPGLGKKVNNRVWFHLYRLDNMFAESVNNQCSPWRSFLRVHLCKGSRLNKHYRLISCLEIQHAFASNRLGCHEHGSTDRRCFRSSGNEIPLRAQ